MIPKKIHYCWFGRGENTKKTDYTNSSEIEKIYRLTE